MLGWRDQTSYYQELEFVSNDRMDSGNSCCICYFEYSPITTQDGAEIPVQLACGHVIGATCIDKWTSTRNTCPLCRTKLFEMDDLWDYERWQYEVEMIIDWFVASPKHQSQTKDLTWEQLVAPEAVDLLIDDLGVPEISNTMHQLNFTESYYRYDIRAELSSREQVSASAQNNEYNDFWILTVDDANLELPHVIQPPSSKTRNSLFDVDQDSIHLNASFEELLESHEHWMAELLDNAEINTDDIYNFWCN